MNKRDEKALLGVITKMIQDSFSFDYNEEDDHLRDEDKHLGELAPNYSTELEDDGFDDPVREPVIAFNLKELTDVVSNVKRIRLIQEINNLLVLPHVIKKLGSAHFVFEHTDHPKVVFLVDLKRAYSPDSAYDSAAYELMSNNPTNKFVSNKVLHETGRLHCLAKEAQFTSGFNAVIEHIKSLGTFEKWSNVESPFSEKSEYHKGWLAAKSAFHNVSCYDPPAKKVKLPAVKADDWE